MNSNQFRRFQICNTIWILSSCFYRWDIKVLEFYTIVMWMFIMFYYIKYFIRDHGSSYRTLNVLLIIALLICIIIVSSFLNNVFNNNLSVIYFVVCFCVSRLNRNEAIDNTPNVTRDTFSDDLTPTFSFISFIMMYFVLFIYNRPLGDLIQELSICTYYVLTKTLVDRPYLLPPLWPSLKKLHKMYIDFLLASSSWTIFSIVVSKKNIDIYNYQRNVHEVVDLLPLHVKIQDYILLACSETLVIVKADIKRSFKVMWLYYKRLKTVLIYIVIVSFSACLFIFLSIHALSFVNDFVDNHLEEAAVKVHSNLERNRHSIFFSNGKYEYERYINEDVYFICNNFKESTFIEKSWYRDNNVLSSNDRIQILGDRLNINLIESSDFGNYKCVTKYMDYFWWYPIWYRYRLYYRFMWNRTVKTSTFHLKQRNHKLPSTYYIEHGRVLVLTADMLLSQADHEDISVEYKVNGVDVDDLCVSDFMSCSLFSWMAKKLDKDVFRNRVQINHLKNQVVLRTCVCSGMYGLHDITIYREFYNKTTGTNVVLELEYPIKIYIWPMDNKTFVYEELYESKLSKQSIRHILNAIDEIVVPRFLWFPGLTINILSIFNAVALLVSIFIIVWFSEHLIRLYCKITIEPFRNMLLFRQLTVPCLPSTTRPLAGLEDDNSVHYDVYISSCEEDRVKAMDIVTFLENCCNLKVCFPERDLADEGNRSYFESFSRTTQQCRMFVVLLSKCYIQDEMCNDVQLMSCILPLIHSSRRRGRDLVFLKLEHNIDIPIQISYDPDVTIISYTSDDNEDEVKRKLKRILMTDRLW